MQSTNQLGELFCYQNLYANVEPNNRISVSKFTKILTLQLNIYRASK